MCWEETKRVNVGFRRGEDVFAGVDINPEGDGGDAECDGSTLNPVDEGAVLSEETVVMREGRRDVMCGDIEVGIGEVLSEVADTVRWGKKEIAFPFRLGDEG